MEIGFEVGARSLNEIHCFSLDSLEWKKYNIIGDIPSRDCHTSVSLNDNQIFLHGGKNKKQKKL